MALDPAELENLYGQPSYEDIQYQLMAGLLTRMLQVQDPLPMPTKYEMKVDPRNYWAP